MYILCLWSILSDRGGWIIHLQYFSNWVCWILWLCLIIGIMGNETIMFSVIREEVKWNCCINGHHSLIMVEYRKQTVNIIYLPSRLSVFQMSLALARSQSPRQNYPCGQVTDIVVNSIMWLSLSFFHWNCWTELWYDYKPCYVLFYL